MLRLARRLLTARLRRFVQLLARLRSRSRRTKLGSQRSTRSQERTTLQLEPYEARAEVGSRLEGLALGLVGFGVAATVEPLHAMVAAVGEEALLAASAPAPDGAEVAGAPREVGGDQDEPVKLPEWNTHDAEEMASVGGPAVGPGEVSDAVAGTPAANPLNDPLAPVADGEPSSSSYFAGPNTSASPPHGGSSFGMGGGAGGPTVSYASPSTAGSPVGGNSTPLSGLNPGAGATQPASSGANSHVPVTASSSIGGSTTASVTASSLGGSTTATSSSVTSPALFSGQLSTTTSHIPLLPLEGSSPQTPSLGVTAGPQQNYYPPLPTPLTAGSAVSAVAPATSNARSISSATPAPSTAATISTPTPAPNTATTISSPSPSGSGTVPSISGGSSVPSDTIKPSYEPAWTGDHPFFLPPSPPPPGDGGGTGGPPSPPPPPPPLEAFAREAEPTVTIGAEADFYGSAEYGDSPYTYSWQFTGGGTSDIQDPTRTFAVAGAYTATLTVTDSDDETSTSSVVEVVVPPPPVAATASDSPATATIGQEVQFTGSGSYGYPGYTYSWTFGDSSGNGEQDPSHAYGSAGTFTATLTVTDTTGATSTSDAVEVVVRPLTASASDSPPTVVVGQAVNFTGSGANGVPGYTYYWTFGDGLTATVADPTHPYAAANTYTATVTVTDATGATSTSTAREVVLPPLTAIASESRATVTINQNANFIGSGSNGMPAYSYSWTFGDDSGAFSTAQDPSHAYAIAGVYTATLMVSDTVPENATSTVVEVVVPPLTAVASEGLPTVTIGQNANFYGNGVNGVPDYSYSWKFGDGPTSTSTFANPAHAYAVVGTYTATLTVRDNDSENASSTVVEVVVPPLTAIASEGRPTVTIGQNANFYGAGSNGVPAYSYSWTFGDSSDAFSTAQDTSHAFAATGTYTVTLTMSDDDSGNASSTVVEVVVPPLTAIASEGRPTVTIGQNATFTGSASNGVPAYSYSWTFGDSSDAFSTAQNPSHAFDTTGTYTVTLTVSDNDVGSASSTVEEVVVPGLGATASANRATVTVNQNATFSGSGVNGVPPYTYSWTFGDGSSPASTSQNPSHAFAVTGTYTVTLSVRDNDSGSASSTAVEVVVPPLTAIATESLPTVTLGQDANFFGSASNGVPAYTYSWTFGDEDDDSSDEQSPSHDYADAGTYTATLTVNDDDFGMSESQVVEVVVYPPLTAVASASPATVTIGDTIDFVGGHENGTPGYTYSWTFGDPGGDDDVGDDDDNYSDEQNPTDVYNDVGTYTATLTVIDDGGEVSTSTVVEVVKDRPIVPTATVDPLTSTVGDTVDFTGSATGGEPCLTYSWTFGDGTSSDEESPSHEYDEVGLYTATLTVTDRADYTSTSTAVETVLVINSTGDDLSTVEGTPLEDVEVATFTVEGPTDGDFTASIDWGDGTASTEGTVTEEDDTYFVDGSHRYEEQGDYTITVSVTTGDLTVPIIGSAEVAYAPLAAEYLTAAASPISGLIDEPIEAPELATFTSSSTSADEDAFEVTVDWGDGESDSSDDGDVELIGDSGEYTVSASHTYAEPGAYLVTVTVTDTTTGLTKVADTTATITAEDGTFDPDRGTLTTVAVDPLEATVGEDLEDTTVAAFEDSNEDADATDFEATVDWGDGTGPETATVDDGDDGFDVEGPYHAYTLPGTYLIHTSISDGSGDTLDTFTTITVDLPEMIPTPTLDLASQPISDEPDDEVDVTLAEFAGAENQTQYAVLVNWGDDTGWQPAEYVEGEAPGEYEVTGTHTYEAEGDYFVQVEVQDGTRSGLVGTTAAIWAAADSDDGPSPTITANALTVPTGQSLTNIVVGTADGIDDPEDDEVSIEWGDGTESDGELVPIDGTFYVVGSHEYDDDAPADEQTVGNLTITLVLTPANGEPILSSADVTTTPVMEGSSWPDGVPVMWFVDERDDVDPEWESVLAATITSDEGDTSGDIALLGEGDEDGYPQYQVTAEGESLTFPTVGWTTISTEVQKGDDGPTATSDLDVLVADAPLQPVDEPDATLTAGEDSGPLTVATFEDLNPDATADDFDVTIDWGDGTADEGTVEGEDGEFAVIDDHTYDEPGIYAVSVLVEDTDGEDDDGEGGATLVLSGTATVLPPNPSIPIDPTSAVRTDDATRADSVAFGNATIFPNTGALLISQPLDFDLSPGTDVGGDPALDYNSNTVGSNDPVIEVYITVPSGQTVTGIAAQLTWNGEEPDDVVEFAAPEPSSDNTYVIQLEHDGPVTATWLYSYSVDVLVSWSEDGDEGTDAGTTEGLDPVVVQDTSTFGNGWGLDQYSRLVPTPDGIMRVFGDGDFEVFPVDGGYDLQDEDFGTLEPIETDGAISAYIYTDTHQDQWVYSSEGQLEGVVDPHGLTTAYTYDYGLFDTITVPDGSETQFLQSDDGLTTAIVEPGDDRTVELEQDDDGNLISLAISSDYVAPDGSEVSDGYTRTFSYSDGQLTEDDWGSEVGSYTYDSLGLLSFASQGEGDTLTITPAAVVALSDAWSSDPEAQTETGMGETTTLLLDVEARVWQEVDPNEAVSEWDRNDAGDPLIYEDPNHFLTTYTYDDAGDVVETQNPDGSTESAEYDDHFHELIWSEDGDGNETSYTLNGTGDVVSMTDSLGTTTYSYGDGLLTGLVVSTTDPDGWTTTTDYDSDRRPISVTADGDYDTPDETTTTTYDDNGNVASTTDPKGYTTLTSYDGLNQLIWTQDPTGAITSELYDATGDVTGSSDGDGVVTENTLNGLGVVVGVQDGVGAPGGPRDTTDFTNADGEVTLSIDPMNRATATFYDSVGDVTGTITGLWGGSDFADGTQVQVVEDAYDMDGNVTLEIDTGGIYVDGEPDLPGTNPATGTAYDSMDRPVQTTQGAWAGTLTDGSFTGPVEITRTYYDGNGNVTLTIDPAGRATETQYIADGLPTEVTEGPWGGSGFSGPVEARGTSYDGDGNTIDLSGGAPEDTVEYYNPDDEVTMVVEPMGRVEYSYYDADGNVTEVIDLQPGGSTGATATVASERVVEYEYDGDGQVTGTLDDPTLVVVGSGTPITGVLTDTLYDHDGNVTETIVGANLLSGQKTTTTVYDAFDEATLTIDPMGRETATLYDADEEATASIAGYQLGAGSWREMETVYNGLGQPTETIDDSTGLVEKTLYDDQGDPTETIAGAELPSAQQQIATTAYDVFGNPTLVADADGDETAYAYDADGDVIQEIDGYGSSTEESTYTGYDAFGDVTLTIAGYGTSLAASTETIYDQFGNATETIDPMGRKTAMLYDADNEVTGTIAGYQLAPINWRLTQQIYDAFGDVTETIDPTGQQTLDVFNADGVETSETDVPVGGGIGEIGGTVRTTNYVLDAFGDVTETIDPMDRTTEDLLDADGEVTASVDGPLDGGRETLSYLDAFGEATLTVAPNGLETFDTFNGDGQQLTQTVLGLDGSGTARSQLTQYFPDVFGNVTATIDPDGDEEDDAFDKDGNETADVTDPTATDGASETETTYYNTLGQVTATVDADGNETVTGYDALGRVSETIAGYGTSAAEPQWTYYDADGEVTGTLTGTESAASLVQSIYDPFGEVTETIDGDGHVVAMLYNADGQQTEMIDSPDSSDEAITETLLDGYGDVTGTFDPDGHLTSEMYDADGEVTGTVNGLGGLTQQFYDTYGELTLTIAPSTPSNSGGVETAQFYDDSGNVTLSVVGYGTGDAIPTYTDYDEFGQVATTTDGDGRVTANAYDADGNVTETVSGYGTSEAVTTETVYNDDGNATETVYNDDGNATETIDGLGQITTTTYDDDNQAVSVTDPNDRTTHTYYDAVGNVTGTTDGLGHMTTSVFDDAGNMVETISADQAEATEPNQYVTHFYYDADGNQTGELDADNNLTTFLYDSDGQETETIDPTNHDSYTEYDADGQVTGTVDQLGQKIATEYDADGNVTGVVWTNADGSSAGLETFTFDHADEMLTAANSVGEYSFTYNGAGNVASVSDPFGITLTMGYDAGGNRTSVHDSEGGEVASTFDAADQLATRSLTSGGVTAGIGLSYNAAGEETARTRTADGVSAGQTDTLYDATGDVTSIVTHSATGGSLLDEQYTYDGADRLASKTSDGATTDYGYDDAGQLTSAGSQTYSYDSNGVPNSGGLTPGSDNQVSTDGTWNYTYNLDGELTEKSLIAGGTSWAYAYDLAGNMTSATETVDGTTTVAIDYLYDVFGNLVGRTETVDGDTVANVRYAVDGWDTAQPSPTGNENYNDYATLIPSDGGWTISSWTMFGAGFDQPVATITSSGSVSWYGVDRQGSVETVFDNSGTILASASYDAYGNILSGGVASVTTYGFQGGQYDPATGLTSFGARWYDPTTQQWTSQDPLGLEPGPNASEFVSNGPTDGMDPSGRWLIIPREKDQINFWINELGLRSEEYGPDRLLLLFKGDSVTPPSRADFDKVIRGLKNAGFTNREMYRVMQALTGNRVKTMFTWDSEFFSIEPDESWRMYDFTTNPERAIKLTEFAKITNRNTTDLTAIGYNNTQVDLTFGNKTGGVTGRTFSTPTGPNPWPTPPQAPKSSPENDLLDKLAKEGGFTPGEIGTFFGQSYKEAGPEAAAVITAMVKDVGKKAAVQAVEQYAFGQALRLSGYLLKKGWTVIKNARGEITGLRNAAGEAIKEAEVIAACKAVGSCFAAGTPLRTPDGSKAIEDFKPGDWILSRDEHDPAGPVSAKVVEDVFVRSGEVWELRIGERVIRTSGEHPFYERKRGWVQANELHSGDWLYTLEGQWAAVEEVVGTGKWETLYNLRVSDFHTYFVGCDQWGFSVWAHNADCVRLQWRGNQYAVLDREGKVVAGGATKQDALNAARGKIPEEDYFVLDAEMQLRGALKPEGYLGNPGPYLKSLGKDALGRGYPGPMIGGIRSHAHHIVMQEGKGAGQAAVKQSQAILEKNGINPFRGQENLVWAPQTGYLETAKYAEQVLEKLKEAKQTREGITEALKKIAKTVSDGGEL